MTMTTRAAEALALAEQNSRITVEQVQQALRMTDALISTPEQFKDGYTFIVDQKFKIAELAIALAAALATPAPDPAEAVAQLEQAILIAVYALGAARDVFEQAKKNVTDVLYAQLFGPASTLSLAAAQDAYHLAQTAVIEAQNTVNRAVQELHTEADLHSLSVTLAAPQPAPHSPRRRHDDH